MMNGLNDKEKKDGEQEHREKVDSSIKSLDHQQDNNDIKIQSIGTSSWDDKRSSTNSSEGVEEEDLVNELKQKNSKDNQEDDGMKADSDMKNVNYDDIVGELDLSWKQSPWKKLYDIGPFTQGAQLAFLLRKNFLIALKGWKGTCFLSFLGPVAIVFVMFFLRTIIPDENQLTYVNTRLLHDFAEGAKWHKCSGDNCYTLAYSTNGQSFAEDVMQDLIVNQQQKWGFDSSEIRSFSNSQTMWEYVYANQNKTQFAIDFANTTLPQLSYSMWYNQSKINDIDVLVPHFQQIIDNTILKVYKEKNGETIGYDSIKAKLKGTPLPKNPLLRERNLYTSITPRFLSYSGLFLFLGAMQSITAEKESQIRMGLEVIGMKRWAYWSAWVIQYLLFCFSAAFWSVATGATVQAYPFTRANPVVWLLAIFLFYFSLVCLGFLFASFINSTKASLVLGFLILASADIINGTLNSGTLMYDIFADNKVNWLLVFYPPFNFLKIGMDICYRTEKSFDATARAQVWGPGYAIEDMFVKLVKHGYDDIQPTYVSILFLCVNILISLILVAYLDVAIWAKKGFCFPCKPSFWGITRLFKSKKKFKHTTEDDLPDYMKGEREEVQKEYLRARDGSFDAAVRILGVQKYYKNRLLQRKKNAEHVYEKFDLSVKKRSCTAIIGANGVGKSTLLKMIASIVKQNKGHIYVNGRENRENLNGTRRLLGIVHQQEILFPTLTAAQNLRLFAQLRGIPPHKVSAEVNRRLKQVELMDEKHVPVGSFSGGMKRRISVAIGLIGDPEILLLDEMSTGIDPESKRRVWSMINEMKVNYTIIMSSHSLEEASALGDEVAIIADHELQCVASPLNLKNTYGEGYSLYAIAKSIPQEEDVMDLVKTNIPNSKLVDRNSGVCQFKVSHDDLPDLIKCLKVLEKLVEDESSFVKDFNASQTTLEEVYQLIEHRVRVKKLKERLRRGEKIKQEEVDFMGINLEEFRAEFEREKSKNVEEAAVEASRATTPIEVIPKELNGTQEHQDQELQDITKEDTLHNNSSLQIESPSGLGNVQDFEQ